MSLKHYHLGCPIWSKRDWAGRFFTAAVRPADFLRQYSTVFNAVEGNTTFYGLPTPATVMRWREDTPVDFRFCFKFPRKITHDLRLHRAGLETREFLDRLAPLAERLGPHLLQLPPSLGPADLELLAAYLTKLPREFHYAVEVRHPDFFTGDEREQALRDVLQRHGASRVILDSQALFSAPPTDADTREAQRKKPRLPVPAIVQGERPLLRFIGHPQVAANQPFLEPWISRVAGWIAAGRYPYVFTHTPDNREAPELARSFHERLRERLSDESPLPPWPAITDGNQQLSLF